jgi:hypothetical protein
MKGVSNLFGMEVFLHMFLTCVTIPWYQLAYGRTFCSQPVGKEEKAEPQAVNCEGSGQLVDFSLINGSV